MADKRRNLGIPSGVVFPFAGSTAPYGYLVCDGSAISRADCPSLFTTLGTSHGSGATSQASANETRPVNISVNYIIKV